MGGGARLLHITGECYLEQKMAHGGVNTFGLPLDAASTFISTVRPSLNQGADRPLPIVARFSSRTCPKLITQ